jgi:alkylation response protein AidB-like acyl-CoA dehydrogenase
MLLDLSSDQEFLQETTARFLAKESPVAQLRKLRDDPDGFDRSYWRRGAELGWTSLLVSEDRGGGSVSGLGLVDLTTIAHEFGRNTAPGPLLATNLVAAALNESESASHGEVLQGILAGTAIATWCLEEGRGRPVGDLGLKVERDGADLVITGGKRPVEAACQADYLLVSGSSEDGPTNVLVPRDTPGVDIRPLNTVDICRRFGELHFDEVRVPASFAVGEVGRSEGEIARLLNLALVILSAETVGAMERSLEMTLEWSFDRYSFGRPLASYQELKHRFADMKSWLEAGHAITDAAASGVSAGSPDAEELARVAKAFTGQYGADLVQDCVQIHGGIGITFDHDQHLFLRRIAVDRMVFGSPSEHRQRIADIVERREP